MLGGGVIVQRFGDLIRGRRSNKARIEENFVPGTANDDTLLYGVEVKFYNMEVELDNNLETENKGLFVIGDCSGVTHSLSHASASGIHVARYISKENV